MKAGNRPQARKAFTLVELLVVIGVLGTLVSLLMCAVQNARATASRIACQNNLRQTALALHSYHDSHGTLPQSPGTNPRMTLLSWMGFILPQLDQENLWQRTAQAFQIDVNPLNDPPHVGYKTVVKTYVCPADGRLLSPLTDQFGVTAGYGSFVGIAGSNDTNGMIGLEPGVRLIEVSDGTSSTIMIGERPPPESLQAGRWYTASFSSHWGMNRGPEGAMFVLMPALVNDPPCIGPIFSFGYGRLDNPCDRYHFWSLHPGGANFAFADGSVKFLAYSANPIMPALATRAGGEVVELP